MHSTTVHRPNVLVGVNYGDITMIHLNTGYIKLQIKYLIYICFGRSGFGRTQAAFW